MCHYTYNMVHHRREQLHCGFAAGAMSASQPAGVKVRVSRNVSIADSSEDPDFDLETQCQHRRLQDPEDAMSASQSPSCLRIVVVMISHMAIRLDRGRKIAAISQDVFSGWQIASKCVQRMANMPQELAPATPCGARQAGKLPVAKYDSTRKHNYINQMKCTKRRTNMPTPTSERWHFSPISGSRTRRS